MKIQIINDMQLIGSEHFAVQEILYSQTAKQYDIDNMPKDKDIIDNLNYTIRRLEEIRVGYGKPIIINSCYRCVELNKLVGGVKDSKHVKGLAVDLKWSQQLFDYIQNECSFDKLIREKSGKSVWIHLQFAKNIEDERCKVIYLNK